MAENEKKQPMTKIGLQWKVLRPISEQYRQQAVEFEPASVFVQVDVPLTSEYVANVTNILSFQVSNESSKPDGAIEPFPMLTLAGMRYVREQVEAALNDVAEEVDPEVAWEDEIEDRSMGKADPPSSDEWEETSSDEDWEGDAPSGKVGDEDDDKNWEEEWE